MGDLRPPVAAVLAAFAVSATVTRPAPHNTPIVTTAIWSGADVETAQPYGTDFRLRVPRRRLDVARSAVPTIDRGTRIAAPERAGDPVKTWVVDELAADQNDPDFWRVLVTAQ